MLTVYSGIDKESVCKVSTFWKTKKIRKKPGFAAMQMLEVGLVVLIICHTDPLRIIFQIETK